MPGIPSPTKIYKELQKLVKAMESAERRFEAVELMDKSLGAELKDLVERVRLLEKWHEQTEYAKQVLEEYKKNHPEITRQENINTKAVGLVLAALAALTAVLLATST